MTSFIHTFYSCSNGDRWQLIIVSESGRYFVRHEPNPPSGGQASEVGITEFLSRSGNSPQADALRSMHVERGVTDFEDE